MLQFVSIWLGCLGDLCLRAQHRLAKDARGAGQLAVGALDADPLGRFLAEIGQPVGGPSHDRVDRLIGGGGVDARECDGEVAEPAAQKVQRDRVVLHHVFHAWCLHNGERGRPILPPAAG